MTEVDNLSCPNTSVPCMTSDRISNLPRNVIDDILMRLSLRDAARTSVLSKIWRRRWADIPQVVFDNTFSGILQRARRSSCDDCVMKKVFEVLLLHSGPLHKFNLSIPGLESCPEIDVLILFLSEKDIQDFNLQISSEGQSYHKLTSYFFTFLKLRRLTLSSCIFKPPPSFKGFSKLITLHFVQVDFNAHVFKYLVSSFPLLESLTLDRCTEIFCLEFNAPNLKFLYYNGIYKSFCFKNTPLLQKIYIYESSDAILKYEREKNSNLTEVFSFLPALEFLSVDYYFLQAVFDASMRLHSILNHLKILHIYYLSLTEMEEVLCALCLLRSSPNLRKLVISVFDNETASANAFLHLLESDCHMDFYLNQLQEVELQDFTGTKPEMDLVKLLLSKSSALKMMRVKFSSKMAANKQFQILKYFNLFKRASVEAEISCEDMCE